MTSPGTEPAGAPRRARLLLKGACGAALLAFLFWVVDRDALWEVLRQLNAWVFLSLPVFYLHTAVKALRWRRYLRSQGVALPFLEANRIYLSGTFLGLISPGRVGEVYRAWILHRERGVNPGLGIAAVLVDRLADVAALLLFGAFGFLYLARQGLGTAAPAILAGPLLPWPGRAPIAAFLRRHFSALLAHMPAPVAAELPGAYRVFAASLRAMAPALFLQLAALTLLSIFIYCAHLYFIATVLGLPIGFFELSGVLCASAFVSLVPVTINAIGTREAFLVATLPLLGVEPAQAFGFALVFLLLFVANALMAFPFWLYGRKGTRTPLAEHPSRGA